MKIVNRIILISTIILFSWIFIFSFFFKSNVYYSENSIISLLLTIPIILLWIIIYKKIKNIKNITIKKEILVLVIYFILVSILQCIVLKELNVNPGWDFGVIYNNALTYAKTGSRSGAVYIEYMQLFPNNILIFLIMVLSIKIFGFVGLAAIDSIHIINIIFIDFSLLLIYLTVRRLFTNKEAIFSLVITFFFQALFLYTPIVYSDTLSLFIGILFIYLFTFINNKNDKKNIILLLIVGIITFIGKSIKVTSLIPLIALIINYFFKYKLKQTTIALLLIIIPFVVINTAFNKIIVPAGRFSFKVNDYGSYPYTHWLMMGVEDPDADNSGRNSYGGYNVNDYNKTLSFKNGKEAQKYNIKEYKRRVSKLGFLGYAEFLTKKNVNIWSDGYYFSNVAIGINPTKDTKLRRFINKENTKFYGIYFNQAVVFSFIMMLISGAYIKLKEKKYKEIDYVRLSIIGILIFLTFWEARSRYLVNFIPIFILIIIEFNKTMYDKYIMKRSK